MPIVDTSTAVATPSTTAARMMKGRISAGTEMMNARADLCPGRALPGHDVVVTRPAVGDNGECQGEHGGGKKPTSEKCRDRDAGDRADNDQDDARRYGFGHGSGCRQQRNKLSGLHTSSLHFRKQDRRHRRHIGGLGSGNAGNQVHRAEQHIRKTATNMTEQRCEKTHHRPRHACHVDQDAEKDEQGDGQQQQMRHALIHATDDHAEWRSSRQRDISGGGNAEGESNRDARRHSHTDPKDEENN